MKAEPLVTDWKAFTNNNKKTQRKYRGSTVILMSRVNFYIWRILFCKRRYMYMQSRIYTQANPDSGPGAPNKMGHHR